MELKKHKNNRSYRIEFTNKFLLRDYNRSYSCYVFILNPQTHRPVPTPARYLYKFKLKQEKKTNLCVIYLS